MPVCLDICLMGERYEAGDGEDPRAPEWPPHPARVFSALRSVAESDEIAPLYELEQLPPPLIHASAFAPCSISRSFVVTNARFNGEKTKSGKIKTGNQNHPARTSDLMKRIRSFPPDPRIQFVWPDDRDLSDEALAGLDALARRVPYLGRSTSPVMLAFRRVADFRPLPGLSTFEPTDHDRAECNIRVPFPGYLDELNALHELDQSSWQASRSHARQSYRLVRDESDAVAPTVVESPYPDLVILRFVDHRPPGNLVGLFTAALRAKVMSQTKNPLPPALHGHGFDGHPHVAYLGLPFAGFPHADGHLRALAVAIPGLDRPERRRILRGILGTDPDRIVDLQVPGFRRVFGLRYSPDEPLPASATAARWTRPARSWVSVTPLVLDRYPKKEDLAPAVVRSIQQAGLPAPVIVELSTQPLTPGAAHLTPKELPLRARGRLYRHVRMTFEHPVTGPVLAGAGRYFGVGLFAPEREGADG